MANHEHIHLLASEPSFWNQWREHNHEIIPDLSGANLSTWDLSLRKLWRANLGGAQLTEIRLWQTDLWAAYLESADIRHGHLVEANLQKANFTNANLARADLTRSFAVGATFEGANLRDANLTETNLNGANLSRADLRGANLSRSQVLGACFEGADLTGACIENWNYGHTTNLNNILCDFIYFASNQQDRRPRIGNFKLGEFSKLVERIFETIDLIFREGVDWLAFQFTFQDLLSQYGSNNLSIQSIEEKTENALIIRLHSKLDTDKPDIERQAKVLYEEKLKSAKDSRQQVLHKYKESLNSLVAKYAQAGNSDEIRLHRLEAELQAKDRLIEIIQEQLAGNHQLISHLAQTQANSGLIGVVLQLAQRQTTEFYINAVAGSEPVSNKSQISTGGGPAISGSVTAGNDFVGRNNDQS